MNQYYNFYKSTLGKHARDPFFLQTLDFFDKKPLNILELGSSRRLDIGSHNNVKEMDGLSTLFWCDYLLGFGGKLTVIDISQEAIYNCQNITSDFIDKININFIIGDGLNYINDDIDLLFLDGSDSPYEALTQFQKANKQKTSILCDDAHVKGVIIRNLYKDCLTWDVNRMGHLMCFYPSILLQQSNSQLKLI